MQAWRTIALSLVTGAALTGVFASCLEPEDVARAQVCDGFCTCLAPLPSAYDECFGGCDADLDGQPLSDACVECATAQSACLQLDACFDICFGIFEEEP